MSQGDKFSSESKEIMRIENELLRIKLKAEYGDAVQIKSIKNLPPEVENQFLKNIIAFEKANEHTETNTVYEKLDKPFYKPAKELSHSEINSELARITALLEKHQMTLGFCDGPYPDEEIYSFITEELFAHEIEMVPVPGMTWNFIYEEFHPNNKADIANNTHQFFNSWIRREVNEYSTEFDYHMITAAGVKMTRPEFFKKMDNFFKSFERFENDGYNITSIDFAEQEDGTAMGFSEGTYKYNAILDNGEYCTWRISLNCTCAERTTIGEFFIL